MKMLTTDAPAACLGCFADFKIVRTRKVAQLIIEVALEDADAALKALGGLPQPAAEQWVAVGRYQEPSQSKPIQRPAGAPVEPVTLKGGKLARKAGILCGEPGFQLWVAHQYPGLARLVPPDLSFAERAAEIIRLHCRVERRAHLDHDEIAAARFREIQSAYEVIV